MKEDRDYRLHYKSLLNFTRQKFDICSLLFCVSSISSINLKSLFGSLVDKEPNVNIVCSDHYLCIYIYVKDGRMLVLDLADFQESRYEEFTDMIQEQVIQNLI